MMPWAKPIGLVRGRLVPVEIPSLGGFAHHNPQRVHTSSQPRNAVQPRDRTIPVQRKVMGQSSGSRRRLIDNECSLMMGLMCFAVGIFCCVTHSAFRDEAVLRRDN